MGYKAPVNPSEAVGQALCGLVHDISNIVQTVLLRAEVAMATEELGDEVCATFEKVMSDSKKSVEVLRYLLEHSRDQVEQMPPTDVAKAIEAVVAELKDTAVPPGALKFHSTSKPLVTHADTAQLQELVAILVEELFRGGSNATRLTITLEATDDISADADNSWMANMDGIKLTLTRDGGGAALEIEDGEVDLPSSYDIPPKVLQLLRAKGIIRQHRGQLRATEAVDDSTQQLSVEIYLPFQAD